MRRDKEAEAAFSRYVTDLRTKQNITLEKLCEGLCTPSNLLYLETGKKGLSKHLQDRILERLGVGSEDFLYMLGYEEYDCWHLRTKVLYAICRGECDRARELLQMYVETYGDTNPLERQFYLRMKAMIHQYEQGDSGEIYALLDEALKLTVPAIDTKKVSGMILSIQELDMLSDRAKYSGKEEEGIYLAIISYIKQRAFDSRGVSKILPKAVVYLYEEKRKNGIETLSTREQMELLDLLSDALEIQRDNCSLYYLWELLAYRRELFQQLEGPASIQEEFAQNQKENEKWLETIEWLYNVTGFHKETRESSNVYFVKGVECVNDVIRIRRKMLGMTATQLCEGICDVRTLRRIEQRKGTPQRLLAGELLERLGLPKEYVKNDMVVQDSEEKKLVEKLKETMNYGRYEEAENILTGIRERDMFENVYNKQFLEDVEATLLLLRGEISKEEFSNKIIKLIQLTVPWEKVLENEFRFFTDNELKYLHDFIMTTDEKSKEYRQCIRVCEEYYSLFFDTEMEINYCGQLDFVMTFVESRLGNMGEFLKSNEYSYCIIKELIRTKKFLVITKPLYNLWWNKHEQQGEKKNNFYEDKKLLTLFSQLASLAKLTKKEKFYLKKINYLYKKII